MKLVTGNTNYCSWSLRAWLALRQTGLPYQLEVIDLGKPDTRARIEAYSSFGRVPILIDGDLTVWDSLAIIEYLNEIAPDAGLFPRDRAARAIARSAMAEMHTRFAAIRSTFPVNIRRPVSVRAPTPEVEADLRRIGEVWREARARFGAGGPFLFGAFSAADAYFAPIASRIHTYTLPVGEVEAAYFAAVMAHPYMAEWSALARAETWVVVADEIDMMPAAAPA